VSEPLLRHPDQREGEGPEAFDREVNLRAIVWITVGLVAVTAVVVLAIWWIVRGFESYDERRDPEPPPIARQVAPPRLPPGPRLQPSPERDLAAMRDEEAERLGRAAWVDRAEGTVRIPIDLAIDAYLAGARAPAGAVPQHAPPAGAQQP
jgi:hypothetical protein